MYRYPKLFYYPKLIEKLFVSLMPNISHGPVPEKRTRYLLEAILDFKENGLTMYENLELVCEWKEEENKNHKLLVKTTCKDLVKLTSQYQTQEKFTSTRVREAVHLMKDFLGILDDHRVPPKQGRKELHFTLSLWSRNKTIILEKFSQKWADKWNEKHSKKLNQQLEFKNTSEITSISQSNVTPIPPENYLKSKAGSSGQVAGREETISVILEREGSNTDGIINDICSDPRIEVIYEAISLFKNSGDVSKAQILGNLLLEQGNLDSAIRQSVMNQLIHPDQSWRIVVEQSCQKKEPFRLFYKNSQQEYIAFTVRYAETSFEEEKGFYLNIWCDETEDIKNPEYPELIHNRCLRFDRVKTILPVKGQWRDEGLDYLEVHLHFCKGMVKAYKPKASSVNKDISNEKVGDIREVVRKVANPFWLIREVFRYGKDCEIISPPEVRSRFRENLKSLCQAYDLEIKD